jgi:CrcB protein
MHTRILVAVALGGAVGAVVRLLVSMLVERVADGPLPLATLIVNVLGCFLFGLAWALHDGGWSRVSCAAVFVGFLGAFTTFSTFAFEGLELLDRGRPLLLALHLFGHNAVGAAAMVAGQWLGRMF